MKAQNRTHRKITEDELRSLKERKVINGLTADPIDINFLTERRISDFSIFPFPRFFPTPKTGFKKLSLDFHSFKRVDFGSDDPVCRSLHLLSPS